MTTTTKLSQQLHRIAAQWPTDPFRPNLQLKTFLDSLAAHPQLTSQAVRASRVLLNNEVQKKARIQILLLVYPNYGPTVPTFR